MRDVAYTLEYEITVTGHCTFENECCGIDKSVYCSVVSILNSTYDDDVLRIV